jgi:CHAT domain-containing protein
MDAYDKALSLSKRALEIREKNLGPEHLYTALSLNNLATLYTEMGAYEKALPLYQRALHILEKAQGSEHPDTANSLNNLALLYEKMGAYDRALSLLQRALKIREKALGLEHPDTIISLASLGAFYLNLKDYKRAEEYLNRGHSKEGLVDFYLATNQAPTALELLSGMTPSMKSPPGYRIQFHTQKGIALAMEGHRGEAALNLAYAMQEIEQVRQRIKEPETGFFQAGLVGGYLRAYRGLVAALAEMAIRGEPLPSELQGDGTDPGDLAFVAAEATKGRVLLESMANAARRQTRVDIPPELRRREEKLLHQMASLEAQWEKAVVGGEEALKEVKARWEKLRGEFQTLIKELRGQYPLYAALHYPQPLPARDLPLAGNEVLLEYALGDQASYVFVVRRGGVKKLIPIPLGREELAAKVRAFMTPFVNRQVNDFSSHQGKELHDLLLAAPLAEIKEGEAVIIVPDGILGLLPFEALVIQEGPGLRDQVYVGDRYTFTYYQSATIMALQRQLKRHRAQRPLFALGNPVFSARDPRYVAVQGGKSIVGPTLAKAQEDYAFRGLASRQEWGQTTKDDQTGKALSFPPLPQTEQEVRAIAQTLGVKPEPPNILLNLNANETRLRQSPLGKYRYLHFATHADLPGKVQGVNEPFILLGQVDNAEGDDGMLTMSKVLGLKLNAEMVVLSACLTGRGQVMEGEGVANFARAFQQAGARSVMVSLWEVASKEVVEYMTIFYGHLKEGKSRSQALCLARQEIKAKTPPPFYWAAFILHGEG